MSGLPCVVRDVTNLQSLGVDIRNIILQNVSISQKFIVIMEKTQSPVLTTIDLSRPTNQPMRKPTPVDNAIINPLKNIMALRAPMPNDPTGNITILQVTDFETQQKYNAKIQNQKIQLWKWQSPTTIGIVTESSYYEWKVLEGQAEPKLIFQRDANLAGCQILDIRMSGNEEYVSILGIKGSSSGTSIDGFLQLFIRSKNASNAVEGYGCAFGEVQLPNKATKSHIMAMIRKTPTGPRVMIADITGDLKVQGDAIANSADVGMDFPVSMEISPEHGFVYVTTKAGFVHIFDLISGAFIMKQRICDKTLFATIPSNENKGIITVAQNSGQVYAISINDQKFIPYLISIGKTELALSIANRTGFPGADELMRSQLDQLLMSGNVVGAAELCSNSKPLRSPITIDKFRQLPPVNGQSALLVYFSTISKVGKLNKLESVELSKIFVQSNRSDLLEKWINDNKFETSKELGDLIQSINPILAMKIYHTSGDANDKVVETLLQSGQYDKAIEYCKKTGFHADFKALLGQLITTNPEAAKDMAIKLIKNEGGALIDVSSVVEVFLPYNIQMTDAVLLDVLAADKPEDGQLQTKFFEINFNARNYSVIDAVFDSNMFSHFDKPYIGQLAEKNGMYGRALQCYCDCNMFDDVKRAIVNTHAINAEFLIKFFSKLTPELGIECMKQLLLSDIRKNLELVVHISQQYSDAMGEENLISLFENFHSFEGIFYYVGAIINSTQNPTTHFKYVEAAVRLNQWPVVETICRESQYLDPTLAKDFLMKEHLKDPRPLIYVCHNHGFIDELTEYLFKNNLNKFLEIYLMSIAPENTPKVVAKLLDLNAQEDQVKLMINNVGRRCSAEDMVTVFEDRNRLRMLQGWLESRIAEGDCQTVTHNAIGKIYITMNKDAQHFLQTNRYYDSKVIGEFCIKLDPFLAFLAYKRANGECDTELLQVTNDNELFKDQARYLIQRQDPQLWAKVLSEENEKRPDLIKAIVQTALPEIERAEEVSSTVQAFIDSDLQAELIDLLEKLVLHGTKFADNAHLQGLLLKTAIACTEINPDVIVRVNEYIHRLDHYDPAEIAELALNQRYHLYTVGFEIYKKFSMHVEAMKVLIGYLNDLVQAEQYAEKVDLPEIWSILGSAQLDNDEAQKSISSYLRANDPNDFRRVISAGTREEIWDDVIAYILMVRKTIKDKYVDTELAYSYARSGKLEELEAFISTPNTADIQNVGDKCFEEASYEAAKILYISINNNAKLASCRIHLGEYREAVEAAKKANSLKTWQEVSTACVEANEFKLALICGLKIIVAPDYLDDLIKVYESYGNYNELINLMEQGLTLEEAHSGIFTELAILYSKYKPETTKLMDHIVSYWNKMNMAKVIRVCEGNFQWKEAAFLYEKSENYDQAIRTMVDYPIQSFEHDKFLELIPKVRNQELYYRSVEFYISFEPMKVNKLLSTLRDKLEHSRVVSKVKATEDIPLIMPYLLSVQNENIIAVNDAINTTYIDEENYEALRVSIDTYDKFDQIKMAKNLEDHELLEFRRISAYLYKRNKRFKSSIELSKLNRMYMDAIDAANCSKDIELVDDLIKFFVDKKDNISFCATLYTCFDLISPDTVIELAWKYQLLDYAIPFIIQYTKNQHELIKEIDKRTAPKPEKEEEEAINQSAQSLMYGMNVPLAITDGSAYGNNYDMGMNMGGGMNMNMGMGMGMNNMGMGGMGGMGMGMQQW